MSAPGRKADLTEGPIFKHILRMSIPMMIGMTAHMIVNIIDGIYAGRLGTQESLAVLNYGFPFFYLFFAVLNGMGSGLSSTLARAIGAKQLGKAEQTLAQCIWICMGIMAVFLILYPLLLPYYLKAQGASAAATLLTHHYLRALFLGLPFTILATLLGSSLRAEGNTRTLMNAMMVGTLSNIIVAPFIIYSEFHFAGMDFKGLGLSVAGAGFASTGSAILSCGMIVLYYLRGKVTVKFHLATQWEDLSGFRDSLRVAFPSILSQTLIGLNLAVMTHLAQPFGESAVAAIGIASRLDIVSVFPALSLMVAVVSLVGQNFGAGKMDRVRESVRIGLLTSFVYLTTIGVAVFLLRHSLVGVFHPDPSTLPSALHFLSVLTVGYGFLGMGMVASGAFQGLGRGLPYLSITLTRLLVLSIPSALLMRHFLGEKGLHYAPPLASVITGITATLWISTVVKKLAQSRPV